MEDISGVSVLLVEGFARQTLPMAEALHKDGCFVATLCASKLDAGYASKYPDKKYITEWDRENEEKSYEILLDTVKNNKFDVIIPMTDFSAHIMAAHRDELKKYTNPHVPEENIFRKAADKLETMIACMDAGVPCPVTLRKSDTVDDVINSGLGYPLVIKPRVGYGGIGFHKIENEEQLRNCFEKVKDEFGGVLVQEYIPQTDIQYQCEVFIDAKGQARAAHVFNKTRWYPVDGGSNCCGESVERPEIAETCVRLLRGLNWRGYADVDMIFDPRDKRAKIVEINPRITAGVKLCFYSGVDFARQIVELETGREVTDFSDYKTGLRLRYLHTDLLWFIESKNRFKAKPSWFNFAHFTDQIWNPRDIWPWFTYTIQGFGKFGKEKKKRKR